MYPAVKSNAVSEAVARAQVGSEAVDRVLALNCSPTDRVIDASYELIELSASVDCEIDGDEAVLTVYYLVNADDYNNTEDMRDLYSDRTFTIE